MSYIYDDTSVIPTNQAENFYLLNNTMERIFLGHIFC